MRNTSDVDETVHLLSVHFKVPKERVLSSYPYKGIWDLSFEEAHPMFERGDRQILWRAHLLRGHQDWDEAQRGDERLRGEMRNLEEKLSRVKG
jgi:hypothetical protein